MIRLGVFGSLSEKGTAPGWSKETVIALLGSAKLDLSDKPPGPGATLTLIALLGSAEVIVPPGSQLSSSGIAFIGSRELKTDPREAPRIHTRLFAVLGVASVKEPKYTKRQRGERRED